MLNNLSNCGELSIDLYHYLQLEIDCNTVRVMIHNGIVKAYRLDIIDAAKHLSIGIIYGVCSTTIEKIYYVVIHSIELSRVEIK